MKTRRIAWSDVLALSTLFVIIVGLDHEGVAKDTSGFPLTISSAANMTAGGVKPARATLKNPHAGNLQSVQTGARLFSTMNCDGCHGGGGLGWVGPSLIDGRWHHGGADHEIFHSIFYGRPKGMPAYGGVLGSEGTWMLVTYLKSQPVPNVVPTTSYEKDETKTALETDIPSSLATVPSPLPATGMEEKLTQYGCVACHAGDKTVVGPSFKDVATKYRTQAGAAAYLAKQVQNGGAGVWGTIPMPPHVDVPNTDLDAIIAWILTVQ